jgi:hypothetical protein
MGGVRWIILLVVILVAHDFCTATVSASKISPEELRAVIHTWRSVRQIITNGAPINRSIPCHISARGVDSISEGQKQEILELARQVDMWRGIWFIDVKHGLMHHRAIVYFVPDETRGRVRRGKSASIILLRPGSKVVDPDGRVTMPYALPGPSPDEYIQLGDGAPRSYEPGSGNLPFSISSGLSTEEIAEIVELIYVGPKPKRAAKNRIKNPFVHEENPNAGMEVDRGKPIMSIHQAGDVVKVEMGQRRGPLDGRGQTVECKKKDGVWVITDVWMWVN